MSEQRTYTVDGTDYRVTVEHDPHAESPRDWSNVSTMVLGHRRYTLPSEDQDVADALAGEYGLGGTRSLRAIERWLRTTRGARVVLPVWGYDHGALALHAGHRSGQYADPWDSGLAGLVFDTPKGVSECMGEDVTDEAIEAALRGEVEDYSHWQNGGHVAYVIEREIHEDGLSAWAVTDACGSIADADHAWSMAREEIGVQDEDESER